MVEYRFYKITTYSVNDSGELNSQTLFYAHCSGKGYDLGNSVKVDDDRLRFCQEFAKCYDPQQDRLQIDNAVLSVRPRFSIDSTIPADASHVVEEAFNSDDLHALAREITLALGKKNKP